MGFILSNDSNHSSPPSIYEGISILINNNSALTDK